MKGSRVALAACALLLVHRAAAAQMIPLIDDREIVANATHSETSAHQAKSPPSPFAFWSDFVSAYVPGVPAGSVTANAFQSSIFLAGGIQFSGGSDGSWNVVPASHYDAKSHVRFKVRANQCLQYTLHVEVDAGTSENHAFVNIRGPGGTIYNVVNDTIDAAGRVPSGDYTFEGESSYSTSVEEAYGGTYAMQWTCGICSTIIGTQPSDQTVACNAVATFCVVANGAGPFTYQWRRNYLPLSNTTHYTGVNTSCLSVQHACYADTGYYDVLVTSGATTEPSRAARLDISSIAVGVAPGAVAWTLGAATPSPTRETSSFHYAAPAPFHARATIHDTAGRIVSRLADGVLAASGTLTWDGRTASGTPAVPGIYFLRFESGGAFDVRRIVRVR
jgi:hypothetical protein